MKTTLLVVAIIFLVVGIPVYQWYVINDINDRIDSLESTAKNHKEVIEPIYAAQASMRVIVTRLTCEQKEGVYYPLTFSSSNKPGSDFIINLEHCIKGGEDYYLNKEFEWIAEGKKKEL